MVPWWHFICFVCPHSFIFYFSLFLFISSFFILFLCLFFIFLILFYSSILFRLSGVPPFREHDTVTGMNLTSRIEKGIFDFPYELWSGVSDEGTLPSLSPLSLPSLSPLSLSPLSPLLFLSIFFCSYGLGHEVADGGSSFTIYNRASHGAPLDNGNKRRREGGRREEGGRRRKERSGDEREDAEVFIL